MGGNLLERDHFLSILDESLRQAAGEHGRVALVSGEAGIGKTSLVECFLHRNRGGIRTLWGACEALFTPRPLGPLYDWAQQARTPLRTLLDNQVNRATLFAAVLDELAADSAPTVAVFEDIHWADEATLDLIKFLARRVHRLRTLFVLTYRDDELSKEHPLRLVLGDLPARDVTRLRLLPLSEASVTTLAQARNRPLGDLYRTTGGNPFFLAEVLASDAQGVPTSVADAVRAQVARRSPEAQSLLERVAVVPSKVERRVIDAAGVESSELLDECVAAGILHVERGEIGYRHELARQAVEDALSPARRRALHAQILQALLEHPTESTPLARLVHHAARAEDGDLVLRFAPAAAKQASAQGAHREAAAHFAIALTYAYGADEEQRAELLDGLSYERYLTGRLAEAVEARLTAVAIWRRRDRKERLGHGLRQLSRLSWFLSKRADAERYGEEAVTLLETLPPNRELAMAYGNLSQLGMLTSDNDRAVLWGGRAIELAEQFNDPEIMCYALGNIGSSEFCAGDARGQVALERSLQLGLEHGFEEHVARAYCNLTNIMAKQRDYPEVMHYLDAGMAYCAEHDLDSWGQAIQSDRACARLDIGDWIGAEEDATALLGTSQTSVMNRISALLVLGLLRARRGDPGAEAALNEALDLAQSTGEIACISPTAAARAEWRWLQGDRRRCRDEAAYGLQLALQIDRPWYWGEVAIWLWRGGGLSEIPHSIPTPYALQIAGEWRAAAAAWEDIGCPYEQALALAGGDESAQRSALAILERLGAVPAADIVRRRLRATGARGLPRGPRPATLANPHGLTARQLEILQLLAEGLRNAEIAERLSTTPKTTAHHVSDVLAKLQVRSRVEAVHIAHQLGLVP